MTHSGAMSSNDQAAGLRSLMARQGPRLVTVCESRDPAVRKGVAGGLAGALVRQGQSVLLLDDARPDRLRRWLPGRDAGSSVLPLPHMPASLGELLAAQGHEKLHVVLVDAQSEGKESVLAGQAPDALMVVPGNDASGAALTAAYAAIKYWHASHPGMQHRILITEAESESRAYGVFCRLATVAARYLTVKLSFVGYLPSWTEPSTLPLRAFERLATSLPRWTRS